MMQVIVATNNEGKVREFSRIFAPFGIQAIPQKEVLPNCKVEEIGTTFAENSYLKAQAVHNLTGQAVVADDSGLCVDALHGEPGVYSARYGGECSYPEKIAKLVQALEGVPADQRIFVIFLRMESGQILRKPARGKLELSQKETMDLALTLFFM